MKLYKFTEQDGTTYNGSTLWGEGVTHSKPEKENAQMCTPDLLHAYKNKNLAYLLNPIHADIKNPILWEAEGDVVEGDFGKVGCFKLTTIRKLDAPAWVGSEKDIKVRIQFAILCAEAVLVNFEEKYPRDERPRKAIEAAKDYLAGKPDAADAARAAAAYFAARSAAANAHYAAAYFAARAAAYAADSDAAYFSAHAADSDAAYFSAHAAAHAADSASDDAALNFGEIADKAVELIMGNDN